MKELITQVMIDKLFVEYYQSIFRNTTEHRLQLDWQRLYPNDNSELLANLDILFSLDEVRKAVFDMDGEKSPGPDGFHVCFFQKFWEVLKDDIMLLFEEFYVGQLDIERLNYTYIVLLLKIAGANRVSKFRPISILNVVYKIITKVFTNRLNGILSQLIDPMQSSFIQGRFIMDGIVVTQELSSGWFKQKRTRGMLLKLDLLRLMACLIGILFYRCYMQETSVPSGKGGS